MSEPSVLAPPTPQDDHSPLRLNCTINGRFAAHFRYMLSMGMDQRAAVIILLHGAMTLSLRNAGPEIDRDLAHAKAEVSEAMTLARAPETKAKLQTAVELLSKAHSRMRQVQAI